MPTDVQRSAGLDSGGEGRRGGGGRTDGRGREKKNGTPAAWHAAIFNPKSNLLSSTIDFDQSLVCGARRRLALLP